MVRHGRVGVMRHGETYDITFARNDWSGSMAPCTVFDRKSLVWFLLSKLHIEMGTLKNLLVQLDEAGVARTGNMELDDESRLRYGMVAPTEGVRCFL